MEKTEIIGLCVEDERLPRNKYMKLMYDVGFDTVLPASDAYEAIKLINNERLDFDLLLVDLQLGREEPASKFGGYEVIDAWHQRYCTQGQCNWDKPVFIHTGFDEQKPIIKSRVSHFRRDFFVKNPDDTLRLTNTLTSFVATRREKLTEQSSGLSLAHLNEVTRDIYEGVEAFIATSNMPVLITGDTGVGKELLARKIHKESGRKGPFRAINCAAFTENLIYSELFGYVKGAYTDAKEHSLGIFFEAAGARPNLSSIPEEEVFNLLEQLQGVEQTQIRELLIKLNEKLTKLIATDSSVGYQTFLMKRGFKLRPEIEQGIDILVLHGRDGGTLFLDEIADLPATAQAGVLRALEGRGVRPVGYTGRPIVPDVRIIAATNNIKKFEEGEFRHDLFWRLAGWGIELPNLSERVDYARSYIRKRAAQVEVQGQEFEVDDQVVDRIAQRIGDNQFSSRKNLLESGNFRHLNWLIDRACAIAFFKHPESLSLTLQDILDAEKWVVKIGVETLADPQSAPVTDSEKLQDVSSEEKELLEEPIKWIDKAARMTYEDLKRADAAANINTDGNSFTEFKRFIKHDEAGNEKIDFTIIGEYYRVRYCSGKGIPTWIDDLIFIHFWQRQKTPITKLLKDVFVNFCNAKGDKLSAGSISSYKHKTAEKARKKKPEYERFFKNDQLSSRIINDIVDKDVSKKPKTAS